MKKDPVITVVMPCYNAQHHLLDAVESALAQSFGDFELIVVHDDPGAVLNIEQQFSDERIKLLHHPGNKDYYAGLNAGLKKARGTYVCIMNANEMSMPERLAIQLKYMKRWKQAGCIGAGVQFIDKDSQVVGSYSYASAYSLAKPLLLRDKCLFNSSLIIRKTCLEGYRLKYKSETKSCPDYEFMVSCAGLFSIHNSDECLVKKRIGVSESGAYHNSNQMIYADRIRLTQVKKFKLPMNGERRKLHLMLMKGDYLTDEELRNGIDWLNELLTQNRKLRLYDNSSLYQIFEDIIATAVRKNQLGVWSIEKKLVHFLYEKLPAGSTVLELGSGNGTEALLRKYKVVSIEHDRTMTFERTENHTCLYAPIQDGWYAREAVQKGIGTKPGIILVDGPPKELRKGILNHLDLFREINVPVIFDDIDRPLDRDTMVTFCERLNYTYQLIHGDVKIFAFCTRNGY